jgi:2-oxoglutarate ferredoxin oxidoreductase subunit beta
MPNAWCPGCGNGIVLGTFLRAFQDTGLKKRSTVIVSGIGCSSRITQYLDFDAIHTIHGRALAFATGIKLTRPDLKVIVFMGDGDAVAIGGNHLIHAARRNIDLTAIVINNSLYGMTGGQTSPGTPLGKKTRTAPYGNVENPANISRLVIASGATYVARFTTFHAKRLEKAIGEALRHKGFSLVESITGCPTQWDTKPWMLLETQKKQYRSISSKKQISIEEIGADMIGVFKNEIRPEFCETMLQLTGSVFAEEHPRDTTT